jgi:hypothetical protein
MFGRLDWKWIAIGALIMLVLNFLAGLVLALMLRPQLEGVTDPAAIQLTGGQAALAALVSFLSFAIGGFIVGVKSAGRTIVEPGISAAIAVLVGLLITGSFSLVNLLVGALIPFVAGLIGGWIGERRQASVRPLEPR